MAQAPQVVGAESGAIVGKRDRLASTDTSAGGTPPLDRTRGLR
jgi:hypothetical protein